jgi:hypothetical protein
VRLGFSISIVLYSDQPAAFTFAPVDLDHRRSGFGELKNFCASKSAPNFGPPRRHSR